MNEKGKERKSKLKVRERGGSREKERERIVEDKAGKRR